MFLKVWINQTRSPIKRETAGKQLTIEAAFKMSNNDASNNSSNESSDEDE